MQTQVDTRWLGQQNLQAFAVHDTGCVLNDQVWHRQRKCQALQQETPGRLTLTHSRKRKIMKTCGSSSTGYAHDSDALQPSCVCSLTASPDATVLTWQLSMSQSWV